MLETMERPQMEQMSDRAVNALANYWWMVADELNEAGEDFEVALEKADRFNAEVLRRERERRSRRERRASRCWF